MRRPERNQERRGQRTQELHAFVSTRLLIVVAGSTPAAVSSIDGKGANVTLIFGALLSHICTRCRIWASTEVAERLCFSRNVIVETASGGSPARKALAFGQPSSQGTLELYGHQMESRSHCDRVACAL